MLNVGKVSKLSVIDVLPFGYTLSGISQNAYGEQEHRVFLPSSDCDQSLSAGSEIHAFVYYAQDGSLQASLKKMPIQVGEFALLTCTGVTDFGAFFDWGLERDLLVPRAMQHKSMDVGLSYVVTLIHDKDNEKLLGCSKLYRFLEETNSELKIGEAVELLIYDESSLGFKAVINNRFQGLLFKSDLYKRISIGDRLPAFIKHIREDGKIDLSLQKLGKTARKDLAEEILEDLAAHGGISTLTDKSPPEEIQAHYNVSKAAYKRALGNLFKQKKISLSKTHIKLID
ncbi:hypothetical protein ISG33_04910 [Glaciecola sp. MH2013]|nr:hypothetical protein [Glaciecola sp. MH2013]